MYKRQIPNLISSSITIVAVFFAMLKLSVWLTLFVLLSIFIMLNIVKKMAGKSGRYFLAQQQALGDVNGYIEEMINGQRVIKVFCHEDAAKQAFDQKNESLCRNATLANSIANIMMPVMMNLGNLQYVLSAIVGCLLYTSHAVRKEKSGGKERVILHTHPVTLAAMCHALELDSRKLTHLLWSMHPEGVCLFPGGIASVSYTHLSRTAACRRGGRSDHHF